MPAAVPSIARAAELRHEVRRTAGSDSQSPQFRCAGAGNLARSEYVPATQVATTGPSTSNPSATRNPRNASGCIDRRFRPPFAMGRFLIAALFLLPACSGLIGLDEFHPNTEDASAAGGSAGIGGSTAGGTGASTSAGTAGTPQTGGTSGTSSTDCTGASDGRPCGTDSAHICNSGACLPSRCADGIVDARSETCDDGNDLNHDGCSARCEKRNPLIGAPCAQDVDCEGTADMLECERAADGIPGGRCTKSCVDDNDCSDHVCFEGRCLESCIVGSPGLVGDSGVVVGGNLDPTKCHGRVEFGCDSPFPGHNSACLPLCRNDDECGPGYCNPRTGMCQGTQVAGLPYGSGCTCSDALCSADPCRGFCLGGESGGSGTCTQLCATGTALYAGGCGSAESMPQAGACLGVLPLRASEAGIGDALGTCQQLCDCDGQCRSSDQSCLNLDDLIGEPGAAVQIWGHQGFCTRQPVSASVLPSCP